MEVPAANVTVNPNLGGSSFGSGSPGLDADLNGGPIGRDLYLAMANHRNLWNRLHCRCSGLCMYANWR